MVTSLLSPLGPARAELTTSQQLALPSSAGAPTVRCRALLLHSLLTMQQQQTDDAGDDVMES